MPRAETGPKYVNFVVYASQANPSGSMDIESASVDITRKKQTTRLNETFEDGLLDGLFRYEYNGSATVSSARAREGARSMQVDLDSSDANPSDPEGVRRVEVRPPDPRGSAGYAGEETWHGFSVYFPETFDAPGPDPTYFDGLLDEVRLYDQPLSEAQIQADRDGQYSMSPVPVAAYAFDEGEGSVAGDSAGEHDGVVAGASWEPEGKYGGAFEFDGVDDLVRIVDAPALNLTDSFTIEAWLRPDTLASLKPVVAKAEDPAAASGYVLYPDVGGKPAGYVGDGGSLAGATGTSGLSTGSWAHLALTSDGTDLRLYVDGEMVSMAPAIAAGPTAGDLTLGAGFDSTAAVGTWNTFTQLHHIDDGLDCDASDGPPISFGARHYTAGSYTNPGEVATATPTAGDYLEVKFHGGELIAGCSDAAAPEQRYVLEPLEQDRWYDFVLHTRWTPLVGGVGNSVSEVWLDGEQVLGDETVPVTKPSLFWHGTVDTHNKGNYLSTGLYRGPSAEDPAVQLFIDSVRRGNSYGEVAPAP